MTRWYTFDALFAFCDLHASRVHGWPRGVIPYYDRQGFPIPAERDDAGKIIEPTLVWARMHSNREYTVLAQDELPDGYLSTVWLGLDHAFGGGPPLIFETMRFSRDEEELRGWTHHPSMEFPDPETGELTDQLRYTTEEEALAAHHEIMRRIRVREGH